MVATVAKSSLSLTQEQRGLGVLTLGFELQENLQPSVPEEAEPGREERGEKQCREGWETFSLLHILCRQTAAMCCCQPCSHRSSCSWGWVRKSKIG